MSIDYKIKTISPQEVLPLRQKVLRPNMQPHECVFPGDNDSSTVHFGLFHNNKIICVATFILSPHHDIASGNPYQLRGMATDPSYQSQGFGESILQFAMAELKLKKGADLLWCNARLRALHFYEKLGFRALGELFEVIGTGPHKVMYKHLIPR